MLDPRFQILGPNVPPMIGRVAIMERVWGALTKAAPSHLSIVGPRYVGKSVFLKGLEERAQADGSPYTGTILWDLGHLTPSTDADFLQVLSKKIAAALLAFDAERLEVYADQLGSGEYGDLREVMEALQEEQVRLLVLLDGLDRPLAADKLTRNLWDQLRDLASQPNMRLITASRQRLRELIRSASAATSDFWNIFDPNPVKLGVMDETDFREALALCQLGELKAGAEAELRNWSGGFPPLLLALLNRLESVSETATVTPQVVNSVAEQALADLQDLLAQLWDECPEPMKDAYRDLVEADFVNGIGLDQREHLLACGFAISVGGGRLRKGCRLLEQFVAQRRPDQGSVARLFRSVEGFQKNIRSILGLRHGQLGFVDEQLGRAVASSIQDLPDHPGQALVNMRNIAERCFALIWSCEFGPERCIPSEVFGYWNQRQVRGVERFSQLTIPDELGPQCRLLRLLVGAEQNIDRKARHISRQTYHLLDAVVGYGNYGQHTGGEDVGIGTAVAAVTTSLELVARLVEEQSEAK